MQQGRVRVARQLFRQLVNPRKQLSKSGLGLAAGIALTATSNSTSVFSKFFSKVISTARSNICFPTIWQ